ncbi:MAG: DUF4402 domain-containing protein [Sphingomonadaceae bacterium]|jgi:hypothetical protein|nr:DUF4402 domain-containing protein [Sphingomonadaceae bacterium]
MKQAISRQQGAGRGWLWSTLPALACVVSCPAQAQPGVSQAQATATAQIIAPLAVTAESDLSFGVVAVSATQGGSITIEPVTGAATYSGAARQTCGANGQCAQSAAIFSVRGEAGRHYRVSLPATVSARLVGMPGAQLEVGGLTSASRNRPGDTASGALDDRGEDEIRIGGTLEIPAGTEPGIYAAEVPIVVFYG